MAEQFQLFFVERFKGKVLFEVPMSEYTSLRIGGPAEVMAFPRDETDLKELMQFASAKKFPLFILGGGTNLLVRDGGVKGIVVNMEEGLKDLSWQDDGAGEVTVSAGAGLTLMEISRLAAAKGLGGLEFGCGIPGTLGGAVVMNAGAYEGEMKDVVESVEVLSKKGKKGFLTASDLNFRYRSSALPEGTVVVRVHMRLTERKPSEIKKKLADYKSRRKGKGAIGLASAGSIFKNPPGSESAGKLIEEVGFKGERIGGAEVSSVHANYIVNTGSATARDVLTLMAHIRDAVFGMKGVVLEPEVKVVGDD